MTVFIAEAGLVWCEDDVQEVFKYFDEAAKFIKETEGIELTSASGIEYSHDKEGQTKRWATIREKEVRYE